MADKEKMDYTSIRVNPELWKEVKIQAIREGIGVSVWMERAIKEALKK
jgi:predicted HicB family RNase H-like nuclease